MSQVPQSLLQCGRPGLGRSPGEGKGYPLQYSGLENSIDTVHSIAKSRTRLSNLHLLTYLPQSLQSRLLCEELITHVGRTIFPLQGHAGNTSTSLTYCSHFLPSRSKYRAWPLTISQEGPGDHTRALNWGTPSWFL